MYYIETGDVRGVLSEDFSIYDDFAYEIEKARVSARTGHTRRERRYTRCVLMLDKVCFGMDEDY